MTSRNEDSQVILVKYGKNRETETVLLSADNMAIYGTNAGGVILELFDEDPVGKQHKGYRMRLNAEDRERLKRELSRPA